jgi:hypothetical protein
MCNCTHVNNPLVKNFGAAKAASPAMQVGALIVTADDITQALVQWDGVAAGVDAAVNACPSLDPSTKAEWEDFYGGYQTFSRANKNHFYFALGLPEIGDQVITYEQGITAWNTTIASKCSNDVQPIPTTQNQVAANDSLLPSAASTQGAVTAIGDTVVKVGLVVGAIFLAVELLPLLRHHTRAYR